MSYSDLCDCNTVPEPGWFIKERGLFGFTIQETGKPEGTALDSTWHPVRASCGLPCGWKADAQSRHIWRRGKGPGFPGWLMHSHGNGMNSLRTWMPPTRLHFLTLPSEDQTSPGVLVGVNPSTPWPVRHVLEEIVKASYVVAAFRNRTEL